MRTSDGDYLTKGYEDAKGTVVHQASHGSGGPANTKLNRTTLSAEKLDRPALICALAFAVAVPYDRTAKHASNNEATAKNETSVEPNNKYQEVLPRIEWSCEDDYLFMLKRRA